MLGTREHHLTDYLGRVYLFTTHMRLDESGNPRRPDVQQCRTYARQTLDDIACSIYDPFHYRLLDLWLDVFQRPWAQPRRLNQLLDDLVTSIGRGELKAYLEDNPTWHWMRPLKAGPASSQDSQEVVTDGGTDEPRTQEGSPAAQGEPGDAAVSGEDNAEVVAGPPMTLDERRGTPPESLDDAVQRLKSMSDEIEANGYTPKYSDEELQSMAESGNVADERYHVRVMESRYLTLPDGSPGMLGRPFEGKTGNGAKYWSTTFDQLEDADLDPELVCGKVGLDHDPNTEYCLMVIDTKKAQPLTGAASVPATFENVSEFANRELPDEFPPEFTDKTMNEDFQEKYAARYSQAVEEEFLENGSTETEDFQRYLGAHDVDPEEQELLIQRMQMHDRVGNNQYYEGNGLTQDKINGSPNQYGAVETLNFERSKANLAQLKEKGAINEPIKL